MNRFENTYEAILAARPAGQRSCTPWPPASTATASGPRCWRGWPAARSARRSRAWSVAQMEDYAAGLKLPYPLENYWTATLTPDQTRYLYETFQSYTRRI